MKKAKAVYQVHGSEDGVLGIYSNIKLAYERASEYISDSEVREVKSYARTCQDFKNGRWATEIVYTGDVSSSIEKFILNN